MQCLHSVVAAAAVPEAVERPWWFVCASRHSDSGYLFGGRAECAWDKWVETGGRSDGSSTDTRLGTCNFLSSLFIYCSISALLEHQSTRALWLDLGIPRASRGQWPPNLPHSPTLDTPSTYLTRPALTHRVLCRGHGVKPGKLALPRRASRRGHCHVGLPLLLEPSVWRHYRLHHPHRHKTPLQLVHLYRLVSNIAPRWAYLVSRC